MSAFIVSVGIGTNKDSKISGDTVLVATLSNDTTVVLDNWYSDERHKPHVSAYECIGKEVAEVEKLVHERDVGLSIHLISRKS
jgi:hypothetical protein